MIVLILLAFAGMLAGIFLLLNMTPFEFAECGETGYLRNAG